jgi:hypothetical protein
VAVATPLATTLEALVSALVNTTAGDTTSGTANRIARWTRDMATGVLVASVVADLKLLGTRFTIKAARLSPILALTFPVVCSMRLQRVRGQ